MVMEYVGTASTPSMQGGEAEAAEQGGGEQGGEERK